MIRDIQTDMGFNRQYHDGAIDFDELILINDNDINLVEGAEALIYGIVGMLKTPIRYIDGCGGVDERYGSRFLSLRGQNLDAHLIELGQVYIKEIIPFFNGRIRDFPTIRIDQPQRDKIIVFLEVDSVYGPFSFQFSV